MRCKPPLKGIQIFDPPPLATGLIYMTTPSTQRSQMYVKYYLHPLLMFLNSGKSMCAAPNFSVFMGLSCSGNWDPEVEHINSAYILSQEHAYERHTQTVNDEENGFVRHITNDHATMTSDMLSGKLAIIYMLYIILYIIIYYVLLLFYINGRVAKWLELLSLYPKVYGSKPTRGTLGKVSFTSSSGRPMPCEGNW